MPFRKTRLVGILVIFAFILLGSVHASSSTPTFTECEKGGIINISAPWYCNEINQAAASVFGMGEIYEATATLLIVIAFLFLAGTLFGIIPSMAVGNIDPYTTALQYISKNVNETMFLEKVMFNGYLVDSFYTSINLQLTVGGYVLPNFIVPVFASLINIFFIAPIKVLSGLVLDALFLLYTEFYAIIFFMYASIPVFLIPGIILRAIFPTRSVGGMMIAIAIGFYFVMPLLFAVAFYFTSNSALASVYSAAQALAANSQGTGVELNAISPTSPLVLDIKNIQSGMGAYWMSILFYPALIIAVVYESIVIIAQFIGGATKASSKMLRAV